MINANFISEIDFHENLFIFLNHDVTAYEKSDFPLLSVAWKTQFCLINFLKRKPFCIYLYVYIYQRMLFVVFSSYWSPFA